ncbi:hypothetical protein ACFY9N_00065 [Microbacterium sp. NPDC008134]|uniref:hypothetical protein n=1 Tax=Microbacterium sp. NPDC008134 TaxID=3364183 RepID=UPI0036EEBECE
MSNPEGLITSFGTEESAHLPPKEDLAEENALREEELAEEEMIADQDAAGAVTADPDFGLESAPSDITTADTGHGTL